MDPAQTAKTVKRLAAELGFDRCGIARADPIGRGDYLKEWLRLSRAGSMDYLHRNLNIRLDPAQILPNARSAIVVALNYHQPEPTPHQLSGDRGGLQGRIAMYAWGEDYHDILRDKLRALVEHLRAEITEPFETRICVDTAPIVERELAAAAGIGWIGKNTLVLHQDLGSYFFLGAIVTTLTLPADQPVEDHCGSCRACLDACPTSAFPAPYQMDASRCISYLTIEHRGDISKPFQAMIGDWVFGCDVCQEVCPFNRDAPAASEPRSAVRPPAPSPRLGEILAWTDDDHRSALAGSAVTRATPEMLRRNARIAADNALTHRASRLPSVSEHDPMVT